MPTNLSRFSGNDTVATTMHFAMKIGQLWQIASHYGIREAPNVGAGTKHRVRGRHGGVEKGGGWKTSRMTPLPKRGFGPPLLRYVFHPPQVSVLCFSCTKIHDRADQKLFWRGPKIFGRARSLVRFPPPPPHTFCTTPYHRPTEAIWCEIFT